MTEQEELEYLKQNSPYALPDDPSSSGWSTAQIKEKHYAGLLFLYNLFKQTRLNVNTSINEMNNLLDTIDTAYQNILNGTSVKAKYDIDNNEIKNTYAKITDIVSGAIKVLKYSKENGTEDYIYNIEKGLSTLQTAFNLLKTWTDALKNVNGNEAVLRAVQATKDSLGNVISDTYATAASVTLINTSITNIINGTTIVDKAYKDQLGRRIDTTYVTIANIVNALNDTSTNKPLSAAKGKDLQDQINAINTLLASSDTDLDTIQEIVTYIKNNKTLIENITSDKMSYSVLVHNLTTNNDNLPLSASMGYALKAMIDAINDAETGIQAAEALRVIAEAGRVEAEEARQTGYSGFDGRITANEDDIEAIKDGTNIDSFSDVESALSDKADSSDVYNKTEVYTKAEAEALINAKCKETADNLRWELGTYDLDVESDNTSALVKTMPSGTIKANVNKVYGASEVSENEIVIPNVEQQTFGSFDWKVLNGKIYIKKTVDDSSSANRIFNLEKPITFVVGKTYYLNHFSSNNNCGIRLLDNNNTTVCDINVIANRTFTPNENVVATKIQWFGSGAYNVELVYKPMVSLTTVTAFKKGYTGIHNFAWNGVEIKDSNDTTQETISVDLSSILYNGSPLFEENAIKKIGTAVDNIQPYKAHKEIGKKILNGIEEWETQWQYDSTNDIGGYRTTISDIKQITSESTVGNILTDKLDVVSQLSLAQNSNTGICVRANTSNIIIKIVGKNCSTVEAFKTYLQSNPIILYYELDTPIEADIDFSFLKNIQGYSNGSITFSNTNNMDVPSDVDYLVEGVKA